MKKAKIYTRTGDKGETALVSGNRISKASPRIDLYGELDELNSRVGVACSMIEGQEKLKSDLEFLFTLQSAIFDLGSHLACEPEYREKYQLPNLTEELIQNMETEIDRLDHTLPALKNFILPGGSLASAHIHLARTAARRVERQMIAFQEETQEELPQHSLRFLNRLSDYLFVLARSVNQLQSGKEQYWKPRK